MKYPLEMFKMLSREVLQAWWLKRLKRLKRLCNIMFQQDKRRSTQKEKNVAIPPLFVGLEIGINIAGKDVSW